MKKKNEIKVLEGGLDGNNLVQKSRPLLMMKSVPFSLGELKILDTYISRINSHDESECTVVFTKSEFEELMELTRCREETLSSYTKNLLGKVVELQMSDGDYMQFVLFTAAYCHKNEYGETVIELSCSEKAKQLFFSIEQMGYLRYELQNVLKLNSKYSYLLFLYLRDNMFRGTFEIPVSELRSNILDIKNEYYEQFKWFNKDILKKAVAEINAKTDINCEYTTIRRGRTVAAIRFCVSEKNLLIEAAAEKEKAEAEKEKQEPVVESDIKRRKEEQLKNLGYAIEKPVEDEFERKRREKLKKLGY